ncbi:MAG: DUF3786 domain-containing protein [Chloroflexi bacterium]|nr:DUF3786 domain-containing protein [Chloroflexota bacterium]
MENENLTLATKQWNYEKAYKQAYKLACEQLAGIDDIEEQCRRSGAQYQPGDAGILIQYLNQSYLISLPGGEISLVGSAETVPIRDRILILHYFNSAKGTPMANRLITLRELPEGSGYFPTFFNRTSQPILNNFGKEPKLLLGAAEKLGGLRVDYGDAAVTINAFSRVPITIILWGGDDELAPQGNVVFDASISDYLCTEDIVVLCETITWKLIRNLKKA